MRRCVCAVIAVLCLMLTARADAPPRPSPQRIYLGQGHVLTISLCRPLTLDTDVGQVVYQPGSFEAAFTGTQTHGDTVTDCVRLVGLKSGETTTLLSDTGPVEGDNPANEYTLVGWSGDGRFLLTSHWELARAADNSPITYVTVYDSVDVGVLPPKVRRVPLPEESPENGGAAGEMQPSPSGRLFAVFWRAGKQAGVPAAHFVFLYDPARNSLRRLPLADKTLLLGWTDDTHLLVMRHDTASHQYRSYDIASGAEKLAANRIVVAPSVSRRYPEVRLSLSGVPLSIPGPEPPAPTGRNAIHLRSRASGGSLWLNIDGTIPKLLPVCLAAFTDVDEPEITFAPDQSSVLWREHGDLYVSRFAVETATAQEKYDAGDPLTCDEEREVALSNAKQIGLGLLQYVQDYDEQYPPAESFHDGVSPYIQSTSLFSVRQYPFQYAAPDDLSLGHMDNPADTVLGTITLPCAVVTLYADGHVKALPPAPAAP